MSTGLVMVGKGELSLMVCTEPFVAMAKLMVLNPGVALDMVMASRSVTTPVPDVSAALFTVNTDGTSRVSSHSRRGRQPRRNGRGRTRECVEHRRENQLGNIFGDLREREDRTPINRRPSL